MIPSTKQFSIVEPVQVTRTAVGKDFAQRSVDKDNKTILATVKWVADGKVLGTKQYTISGDNYDLLMSASPVFAPNKPQDDFREEDLWYVINLIDPE